MAGQGQWIRRPVPRHAEMRTMFSQAVASFRQGLLQRIFQFCEHALPEHQATLADRLPNEKVKLIERAGHNPQMARTVEVIHVIREFMNPEGEERT